MMVNIFYILFIHNLGQLGDGTTSMTGWVRPNLPSVSAVYPGAAHAAAITMTGNVYTWGRNGMNFTFL